MPRAVFGALRRRLPSAALGAAALAAFGWALSACSEGGGGGSPFGWLRPAPAPPHWTTLRLPSGAVLAYPPSWPRVRSDPGAGSAALIDPRSRLVADYLNATPRQGHESARNWARFRPEHDAQEGDRQVQVLAAARGLRFRGGSGACVVDRYRTTRASYQEIACLVGRAGATGGRPGRESVIVAAALTARWPRDARTLERAVAAFEP